MTEKQATALRIGFFFAALFTVPGVHLPFWSVWLESRGLSPAQISIMLSTAIVLRLIAGPVAAHVVDKSGERRRAIIVLAWASAITFCLFGVAEGFAALMAVGVLHALIWAPIAPFTENLSVLAAAKHGFQYGRVRLWGSLAFLVAAYLAGLFLKGRSEEWIFWIMLPGMLVIALAAHILPDVRLPAAGPLESAGTRAPGLRLLGQTDFRLFLLANAGLQAGHAAYYTFGTLHWRGHGLSDAVIGFLWALAVLAEVVLFALGQRVVQAIGGVGLLWCAVIGSALRWGLQGHVDWLPGIVLLQVLHAATFGAAHFGAMRLMAQHCAASASASAQTIYGAANAALLALATLAVGPLFAWNPNAIYLAMLPTTALGALGTWLLWQRRDGLRFG